MLCCWNMADSGELPQKPKDSQHQNCNPANETQDENNKSLGCPMDMNLCDSFSMHSIAASMSLLSLNSLDQISSYNNHQLAAFNSPPIRPPRY